MVQVRLADTSAHFVLSMEEYKGILHMVYEQVPVDQLRCQLYKVATAKWIRECHQSSLVSQLWK